MVLVFLFQVFFSWEGFHGAKTSLRPTETGEKILPTLNMLWVRWEASSNLSSSGRFWTKDKSNVKTIVVPSSRVYGNWEEKIYGIFMKGDTFLEELSSVTQVRFGEHLVWEDWCSSSHTLLVEIEDGVDSSTVRVTLTSTSFSTSSTKAQASIARVGEWALVAKGVGAEVQVLVFTIAWISWAFVRL